jgi:hypothetical protein
MEAPPKSNDRRDNLARIRRFPMRCGPSSDRPHPHDDTRATGRLVLTSGKEDSAWHGTERQAAMFSWIRRVFARLWRPRRRAVQHDFYDQGEASRYRTLHESRQDGDLPF